MAANHTETYHLCQWEKSDKVLMEDFNADNARIDAALKELDQRVDNSAGSSDVSALDQRVQSLEYQMQQTGHASPYIFRYVGHGSNTCSLGFNHRPAIVFLFPVDGSLPVAIGFYGVEATNTEDVTFHYWPTKGGVTSFTGIKYNQKDKRYIAIGILDNIY